MLAGGRVGGAIYKLLFWDKEVLKMEHIQGLDTK
jgi:hypothetical protein